jgi:hypothetical protein
MAELAVLEEQDIATAAILAMPTKAATAFADYLLLGPDRSLEKLFRLYRTRPEGGPTRQLSKLKEWSSEYGWQERIKLIAAAQVERTAEKRTGTYSLIVDEYYRRVSDEPRRQIMELSALHGIHDRVKPEQQVASSSGGGAHLTIQFVFQEVVRP